MILEHHDDRARVRTQPARVVGTFDRAGIFTKVYLYVALIFLSGAITRPLSGNLDTFKDVGESPAVQYLGLAVYAGGILLGLWGLIQRHSLGRLSISPPLIIYSLLAIWVALSATWSPDPDLSFRRTVAFEGTIIVSFAIAATIPARDVVKAFVYLSIVLIVCTLLLRIVAPVYSVHQAGEAGVAEHAGRLRGSYAHKNDLGRVLMLNFVILLGFGRSVMPNRALRAGVLLIALLLAIMSGSAKIVVIIPAVYVAGLLIALPISVAARSLFLFALAVVTSIIYFSGIFEMLMDLVFESVGRNADMSGRDVIWRVAWMYIEKNILFGQGYATGWTSGAQAYFAKLKYIVIGHAHNGYLNTWLDIGLIGLGLALAPVVMLFMWLVKFPKDRAGALRAFSFMWLVTYVLMNFSGTYLINYNDIYTVVTILCCFWCYGVFHHRIDVRSMQMLAK